MEGIRCRVRRVSVDFAEYIVMPGSNSVFEQISIQPTSKAAALSGRCDHDSIHIHEPRIAGAKPLEVRAVVIGVLIQSYQKRVKLSDSPNQKRMFDEVLQPLGFEPRELSRMRVVKRKHRLPQRPGSVCI